MDLEEEGRKGRTGEQDVLKKLGFYIFSFILSGGVYDWVWRHKTWIYSLC